MDHDPDRLRLDRLPTHWYGKYSTQMRNEYIDIMWEEWRHSQRRVFCRESSFPRKGTTTMLSGEPVEPISLASAYGLLNKTATLYLASGGDPTLHWRFREPTYPVYSQEWLQTVHKTWKDGCGERESFDGRFVFALTLFSAQDDERLRAWIGLASSPDLYPRKMWKSLSSGTSSNATCLKHATPAIIPPKR
ncbi:hypothetical protein Slin14017_G077080 [Septoria linicola]|nr:hypothetical protein Slin14017_G077080 [Septoria linicola]